MGDFHKILKFNQVGCNSFCCNFFFFSIHGLFIAGQAILCGADGTALEGVPPGPDLSLALAAASGWRLNVFHVGARKYTAFCNAFSP